MDFPESFKIKRVFCPICAYCSSQKRWDRRLGIRANISQYGCGMVQEFPRAILVPNFEQVGNRRGCRRSELTKSGLGPPQVVRRLPNMKTKRAVPSPTPGQKFRSKRRFRRAQHLQQHRDGIGSDTSNGQRGLVAFSLRIRIRQLNHPIAQWPVLIFRFGSRPAR